MDEEPIESHPDGFIGEFKDSILAKIPTSEDWAESIATAIMSASVGKNKFVMTKVGPLNLNTFFMIVGTSGLANKTTPLKYFARPMIEEIESVLEQNGSKTDLTMPSRFSIEGLIEYFSKGNDEGIVIRDEFTSALKDASKDYLADFVEFLSEVYDCSVQKRYTRAAKLEQTKRVYISFLGATTPFLYTILNPSFFNQGLGNRLMFCIDVPREAKEENPDVYFSRTSSDDEREVQEQRRTWALRLVNLRNSVVRNIVPGENDGKLLVKFKYELEREMSDRYNHDQYDLMAPYLARSAEMSFKLTALHFLSKTYYDPVDLNPVTTLNDAPWAVAKVRRHIDYFKKMLELWRARPENFTPKTMDTQASQVTEYLYSRESGVSWSQLRADIKWNNTVWNQVLNFLYDTGRVKVTLRKQVGPGRPTIVFYDIRNYNKMINQNESVINDWFSLKTYLHL